MPSFIERIQGLLRRLKRRARATGSTGRDRDSWDKNLVLSLSKRRLPSWRQIRHLPEVLSSSDSLRLRLGSVLIVAGLAILGLRYYGAHTVMVPAVGGEITEGVVGTPRSLNPILSVLNDADMDLTRLMFSRLYTTDGKGDIVPDLATRTDVSDDRKTYVIAIDPAAKWHDGNPVTADDVVFTVALIQDPNWRSPLLASLRDVTAEKIGEREIRFSLKEPYAPFLSLLTFGILPQHVWKDIQPQAASQAEANLKPVGSGPFAFEELKRDKRGFVLSYTLKRNPDYHRNAPFLERLTFRFYPDDNAAIDALRRREVDSLSFVPRDRRGDLSGLSHVLPVALEPPQYTAVFFNQRKNEILKDKGVRRALALAVDKGRIIRDVLDGDGHPLDGPVLPGYTGLLENAVPHDLEQAKSLLDGLGWKTDSADGIRKKVVEKTTVPLKLTFTTIDQPETMKVARIIKDAWTAIGVDVTISAQPAADVARTAIKPREYEALLYGQLLGVDADPYPFWHSSQVQDPGLNLALFANRSADDAIEAARRTSDPAVRQEQHAKLLEVLAQEIPAIFLYSPTYTYPMPADLKGFGGTRVANPSDRFATVTDWYLETKRAWR